MTASASAAATPPERPARRPLARAVRVVVAAGLFALVLWFANPRDVARELSGASWTWIAAAAALVLIDRTLMAWRWIALLTSVQRGAHPPFAALMRIFFVSTFVGTFLPSIGGDAVRAWSLSRAGVTASESFASVLMDRLLGVISILIAAAAGLMIAPDLLGERAVWSGLALMWAGCAGALAVVFSPGAARALLRLIHRAGGAGRVHRSADRLFEALQAYREQRSVLAGVLAASVGVQAIRVLQAWLLGLGLGITTDLSAYVAFIPVILLVLLLPFPGNGIGSAGLAFWWLFGRVGVPEADAVALSVLFIALGIVGNLPGGLLYAFGGSTGRRAPAQP